MRPTVIAGLVLLVSTSVAQPATSSTLAISADQDTVAAEQFTRAAATITSDMRPGLREEIHAARNTNGELVGGSNPPIHWTGIHR